MALVLVVEDDESFSDALSCILPKEGFEVAVRPIGPDALETFNRNGADLVLLDRPQLPVPRCGVMAFEVGTAPMARRPDAGRRSRPAAPQRA